MKCEGGTDVIPMSVIVGFSDPEVLIPLRQGIEAREASRAYVPPFGIMAGQTRLKADLIGGGEAERGVLDIDGVSSRGDENRGLEG